MPCRSLCFTEWQNILDRTHRNQVRENRIIQVFGDERSSPMAVYRILPVAAQGIRRCGESISSLPRCEQTFFVPCESRILTEDTEVLGMFSVDIQHLLNANVVRSWIAGVSLEREARSRCHFSPVEPQNPKIHASEIGLSLNRPILTDCRILQCDGSCLKKQRSQRKLLNYAAEKQLRRDVEGPLQRVFKALEKKVSNFHARRLRLLRSDSSQRTSSLNNTEEPSPHTRIQFANVHTTSILGEKSTPIFA